MQPLSSDMHPSLLSTQLLVPMLPLSSAMHQLLLPTLLLLLTLLLLVMRLRSLTPTSTELLMTTPTPTLTLLRMLMLLEMCRDPTLLLSLMAVSRLSSTPLTTTMDMLLMSPMREHLSTPLLLFQLLPQLIKDRSSVCSVNIYSIYCRKYKISHIN